MRVEKRVHQGKCPKVVDNFTNRRHQKRLEGDR